MSTTDLVKINKSGKIASSLTFGRFGTKLQRIPAGSIAMRLFLTCWLVYVAHFATNVVRETYPVLSLGDHLSFDVSEYAGLHPDIFEMPGRGAFINNNPGASMLGAIPYAAVRPVIDVAVDRVQQRRAASPEPVEIEYDTPHTNSKKFLQEAVKRGLDVKLGLAAAVTQALLMAPFSALSVVVMFYVLLALTKSTRTSAWLALLYAFATPVFYRTAQLNHNLLLAHFAFFAFVMLWRPWDPSSQPGRWQYLLAGLLCGWTVVLDYSGLVVVFALGLYTLARWLQQPARLRSLPDLAAFGAGIAVCALILMGYQWSSFGHPLYPAQHYMPATEFSVNGYSGIDWPDPRLLWESAFGIRFGLFTSAPFLLLALFVPGWFNPAFRIVQRRELVYILGFVVLFFLFSAANQFGYVQFNTGVRHIVPVVPFLFLLAAGVFLRLPLLLAVFVGVTTTYWSWCLAMYRDVEYGLGIFEAIMRITLEGFRLPWLTTLDNMGFLPDGSSALPSLFLLGTLIVLLWRVPALMRPFAQVNEPAAVEVEETVHA